MFTRKVTLLATIVLVGACFFTTHVLSQDRPGGDKEAEMMKAWMDAATPGEHHKALESMAGNFTYTMKMRMDPNQDWMTSEGKYEGEMIMGGRYLATRNTGEFMGQEFLGMGCLGYDNVLGKHVAAWIDNMGTGIMRSEGTCDDTGKVITFEGEMIDAMTKKPIQYKYVYEIKSDDEFTMRWWGPSMTDGKMFESMVIESKRVK
jgi:roadblock/LC7 domain-containing protein